MSRKSKVVAYILWFLFGGLGAHRFYVSRYATGSGYIMLTGLVIYGSITGNIVAGIAWVAFVIWWIVDAFLIPGMVRKRNERA